MPRYWSIRHQPAMLEKSLIPRGSFTRPASNSPRFMQHSRRIVNVFVCLACFVTIGSVAAVPEVNLELWSKIVIEDHDPPGRTIHDQTIMAESTRQLLRSLGVSVAC